MVNEKFTIQSGALGEKELPVFNKNIKFYLKGYALSEFNDKNIDEIIDYCITKNLFSSVKDGHVKINRNTRIPRDIFLTINIVVDDKNQIIKAAWLGNFSESGYTLKPLTNPVALRTIDDLADENKKFLNTVKVMVDKSKFKNWRNVENGYLPGIISKLHNMLNKYNINCAESRVVNDLSKDVVELTDGEIQKKRSSLAFWKNSARNELTVDFMKAISNKNTSSLASVNARLINVKSANFSCHLEI